MSLKNLILGKIIHYSLEYFFIEKKTTVSIVSEKSKEQLDEKANYYAEQFMNPVSEDIIDKLYQKGITPKGRYFGQQFAISCVLKFSKNMSMFSYHELLSHGKILFQLLDKIEQDDLLEAIKKLKTILIFKFPHENQSVKDMNNFSYTILEEALINSKTRHLAFIINFIKNKNF